MSTLHLNRQVSEPTTVVLEDWYEELADESLDPANILEQEEEEAELLDLEISIKQSLPSQTEEANMTSTTLNTDKSFNLDNWLATARAVTNTEAEKAAVIPTPSWLTLKSGRCTPDNAFTITAGVVKATRQVLDALSYTERQLEEKIEELHMQEQRGTRNTVTAAWAFGPVMTALGQQLAAAQVANDHPGFNPDGNEHEEHMIALAEECDKLEAVVLNGKRILKEIIDWITEYAEVLELKVQCGYEVQIGIIGNEIRKARYLPLDYNTLLLAIEEQRAFIRSNRK